MSERTLVDTVAAAKKRHGLSVGAFKRRVDDRVSRAAEEALQVPAHGGAVASSMWSLAAAATRARYWELMDRGQQVLRLCILAALDGYSLAQAVAGETPVKTVIKSEPALARFAKASVSSRVALVAGPLGATARSIAAEYAETERPALRPHPTLAAVDLGGNRFNAKNIELLAVPFFSKSRSLDFSGHQLGDDDLVSFIDHLPATVSRLGLSYGKITTSGLERLSRAPAFERLTHLDLRMNRGLSEHAVPLLERAQKLEYLSISPQVIGEAGVRRLAALNLPKLERLTLEGFDVGGLSAFAARSGMPLLKTLDLPETLMSPALVNELEALYPPRAWPNVFML